MPLMIKSFTDLTVWQKGHILVIETYKITKLFPREELFVLTSQIRRCVISITSNIAEGFGRSGNADKARFYNMAQASLIEFQNQLLVARDIGYITAKDFKNLAALSVEVSKMLSRLITVSRERD